MVKELPSAATGLLEGNVYADPGLLYSIKETDHGWGTPAAGIVVDFQ